MDLFNDPQFEKYRIKEIEEGVIFLREILQDASPEYFRGAIEMLKRIMNIPIKMIPHGNESQQEQAQILKARAFDAFEVKAMRRFILDE